MKTILIDDESNNRYVLRSILERYHSECDIVGEASNVSEAYELILRASPDLIFLDIQMPHENGFELLKKFGDVHFEVIFVTSFDKYAIDAIRFSALDYLLKPVDLEELRTAIERAKKKTALKQNSSTQIDNLLHNLEGDQPRKIVVHDRDTVKLIDESQIISIMSDGSYCHIQTKGSEVFTVTKYLKDFESYFGEKSMFIRISRSLIINAAEIKQYSKSEPCIIELSDNRTVEVSRRKKSEVLALLAKF